ncbi:hypothetical protein [Clostridium magnum]|uniref:Uncharacterized protein n=1 Tax=Clostridium magnum DSM 2767 TaxID=1121326 RepID=A0A161YHD4_9CLOT|nr:hypothetical protein [Clostridium magnum]KZL89662.1 hypothetical protein CLMAG_51620 [Clostridium magnum DSM 2767]SHH75646.1 hypothetical protein SAMN02745944_01344 [Clostridium magnum DSM 2767]
MKILLSLIIITANYYSFTYGIYLWKRENNRLAAFGVLLITFMGIIVPIVDLYIKM